MLALPVQVHVGGFHDVLGGAHGPLHVDAGSPQLDRAGSPSSFLAALPLFSVKLVCMVLFFVLRKRVKSHMGGEAISFLLQYVKS